MPEITLKAIEELVERVFDKKLEPIKTTLESHTTSLEQLVMKKNLKDQEKTVAVYRFDRLEKWAKRVGEKLGISPEF